MTKDGHLGDENGDGVVNEADRVLLPPTGLVERAHAHGLDGLFSAFPDTAATARELLRLED